MSSKEIRNDLGVLAQTYSMSLSSLQLEFINFKFLYTSESFRFAQEALTYLWNLPGVENEYSLLLRLYTILVLLPYSTADCERGFSTMNDIKFGTRNRLGTILFDLMLIGVIAMYGDDYDFDYECLGAHVASEIWKYKRPSMRQSRFC